MSSNVELLEGHLITEGGRVFLVIEEWGNFLVNSFYDVPNLKLFELLQAATNKSKEQAKETSSKKQNAEAVAELDLETILPSNLIKAEGFCFCYGSPSNTSIGYAGYVYPSSLTLL